MSKKKFTYSIDVALDYLKQGIKEATGKNDGDPARMFMRGDQLAWCAAFVLKCIEESDDPQLVFDNQTYYNLRLVRNFVTHIKSLKRWVAKDPLPNDIIFFGNGAASDVGVKGNHMGLVEFIKDGRVHTVEGNTSNKVARRDYALDDPQILGYGRLRPKP